MRLIYNKAISIFLTVILFLSNVPLISFAQPIENMVDANQGCYEDSCTDEHHIHGHDHDHDEAQIYESSLFNEDSYNNSYNNLQINNKETLTKTAAYAETAGNVQSSQDSSGDLNYKELSKIIKKHGGTYSENQGLFTLEITEQENREYFFELKFLYGRHAISHYVIDAKNNTFVSKDDFNVGYQNFIETSLKNYVDAKEPFAEPKLPALYSNVYKYTFIDTWDVYPDLLAGSGKLILSYRSAQYVGNTPLFTNETLTAVLWIFMDILLLPVTGGASGFDIARSGIDLLSAFATDYNNCKDLKPTYNVSYDVYAKYTHKDNNKLAYVDTYSTLIRLDDVDYLNLNIKVSNSSGNSGLAYALPDMLNVLFERGYTNAEHICLSGNHNIDPKTGICTNCGYTKWFKITYDSNGGDSIAEQTKFNRVPIKLVGEPKNGNYLFMGWATSKNSLIAMYQPEEWYYDNESITLYAIWKTLDCLIHTYSKTYTYDGPAGHYRYCTNCGYKDTVVKHDLTTIQSGAKHYQKCSICAYTTPAVDHDYNSPYTYDGPAGHYKYCICGSKKATENHSLTHVQSSAGHYQKCAICGYTTSSVGHTYSGAYISNSSGHYQKCSVCSYAPTPVAHSFSASYTYDGPTGHYKYCTICGYKDTTASHKLTQVQSGSNHYQKCSVCSYTTPTATHTYGSTYTYDSPTGHYRYCTTCGYKGTVASHSLSQIQSSTGHYQKCSVCGYTTSITGHTYGGTYTSNSSGHYKKCTVCGYAATSSAHTLSSTYTYDGSTGHYKYCTVCGYKNTTVAHSLSSIQSGAYSEPNRPPARSF